MVQFGTQFGLAVCPQEELGMEEVITADNTEGPYMDA